MKFSISVPAIFIFMCFFSVISKSQDMMPPKAVQNSVLETFVGEWSGESLFMGAKIKDEVKCYWTHNHQFLVMELKGVNRDNPNYVYTGTGYYTVDDKGNVISWWFDDWGLMGAGNATGTISGNKMELNEVSVSSKGTRTFETSSNEIKMAAIGTFTMNGQQIPYEETGTYKKK